MCKVSKEMCCSDSCFSFNFQILFISIPLASQELSCMSQSSMDPLDPDLCSHDPYVQIHLAVFLGLTRSAACTPAAHPYISTQHSTLANDTSS